VHWHTIGTVLLRSGAAVRRNRAVVRRRDEIERWRRGATYQNTGCWYSVKPIAAQTAATIQKRRMIFVSDQACSSKW
jgi:hypothetical protein